MMMRWKIRWRDMGEERNKPETVKHKYKYTEKEKEPEPEPEHHTMLT